MASKQQALRVAKRFGLELDESVTGLIGGSFALTFDHPTHSFGGDCRSIHVCDYGSGDITPAQSAWSEAIERMEDEGPHLEPCIDPECDYHQSFTQGKED